MLMRRRHSSRFGPQRKRRGLLTFFLLFLLAAGGAVWFFFFENEAPQTVIHIDKPFLGRSSVFSIEARDNKSGIKSVRVTAVQGETQKILYYKDNPRTGYRSPVGPREEKAEIEVDCKKLGLKEGPVQLVLEVTDFSLQRWLQGNRTEQRKEVTIDTEAPKIHILHSERSVTPGGTGLVIYQMDDAHATTGVLLNGHLNHAYPAAKEGRGKNIFIAYYGMPYNANVLSQFTITAVDKAANETAVPVGASFKADSKKRDTINVSDGFLNRKVPEFRQYYPEMTGDILSQYIHVNNIVRKKNAETIRDVCKKTSADKLWQGVFGRMAGSKRAGFAEYRSYLYKGKVIDHQVHLGVDIASVRQDKVKAANSGTVVYADYLGIYGKMVMIDHGQGVFSLYSHLSQIDVSPGNSVAKDDIIGLTGNTGMAGGDHLHFSMLINGVFVDPKEWWDKNFINLHIEEPLGNLHLLR